MSSNTLCILMLFQKSNWHNVTNLDYNPWHSFLPQRSVSMRSLTSSMAFMRATTLSILDSVFLPCFLQNKTYPLSRHNGVNPPFLRLECNTTCSYCVGQSKCFVSLCCFIIESSCLTLIIIEWLFEMMGLFSKYLLFWLLLLFVVLKCAHSYNCASKKVVSKETKN